MEKTTIPWLFIHCICTAHNFASNKNGDESFFSVCMIVAINGSKELDSG